MTQSIEHALAALVAEEALLLDRLARVRVAIKSLRELTAPVQPPYHTPSGVMAETESAAIEIILAAGRPVPTHEMMEKLTERGIQIGGQHPGSTLSARLSRSRRLRNCRPQGWLVVRESLPGD